MFLLSIASVLAVPTTKTYNFSNNFENVNTWAFNGVNCNNATPPSKSIPTCLNVNHTFNADLDKLDGNYLWTTYETNDGGMVMRTKLTAPQATITELNFSGRFELGDSYPVQPFIYARNDVTKSWDFCAAVLDVFLSYESKDIASGRSNQDCVLRVRRYTP